MSERMAEGMSGPEVSPAARPGPIPQATQATPATPATKSRSPLAHLLHALNQPLTGLQCSLELAVAGPRRNDQYVQTLREGLDLTARMRALVEAIRELTDMQQSPPHPEPIALEALLRETVADLRPVAESKQVRLRLEDQAPHPVRGDPQQLASLMFRLLESILALTQEGGELDIMATNERAHARVGVSWVPGPTPEHSPFSPAELGLLLAQAGWEHAGAEWMQSRTAQLASLSLRLPLAFPPGQNQNPK
jgi:hypothetical protein